MKPSLREDWTERDYQKFLAGVGKDVCPFCSEDLLIKRYKYWILVKNKFPYDSISSKHDMLACKRHVKEMKDLTYREMEEYYDIIKELQDDYTYTLQSMPKRRSIPRHLHIHLLKLS